MATNREDALKIEYADLGVTCGYIGNVSIYGDDRQFKVFTNLSSRPAATACDTSINVERNEDGTVDFDTSAVRAKLDTIRDRFQRGELYAVNGARWQEKAAADAAAGRVPSYWDY